MPTNRDARAVGAWYFALATAPFSLIYVPSTLVVPNDAAATASKILGHEMMFRLSILNEILVAVVFVFLSLAVYRLFSGVNKMQAALAVILGSVLSAPISFLAVVNDIAALAILHAPRYLSVFSKPQLEALALLFLRLHHYVIVVQQVSWGLWLFPFGLLVMRSRFLPRILGILLIINGCAYIALTLTSVLAPDYSSVVTSIAYLPETGELWIALWLLIKGIKPQTPPLVPALA
ncbi:MAG TPA: DUF4386 domain-containing protein [Thermoanaerobaculia bacterium]